MSAGASPVLRLETLEDLVAATDAHPVVVHDLGRAFVPGAYAVRRGAASAFAAARAESGRTWLTFHGARDGLRALVAEEDVCAWARGLAPVSVWISTGHHDLLDSLLELGDGNDWEWMLTQTAPPTQAGEERVEVLDPSSRGELEAFLAEHNPRTFGRPFARPDQLWVGVRDAAGALVASGCSEPGWTTTPCLAGITVRPDQRGSGLGAAVTAVLTREGVRRTGACSLGMYADNAVARRLYHRLGYTTWAHWSTRQVLPRPTFPA